MKKCLILANGRAPRPEVFDFLKKKGYDYFICADGGANSAKDLRLVPDVIIGDLDSVLPEVLDFYKDKSKIVRVKFQDYTDVEKAFRYAVKKGYTEAFLLGGTGDRLDHTFCNMGIVLSFYDRIKISLVHEQSLLTAHSNTAVFNTAKNEIFSIYGFDSKTKITTKGLRFKLKSEALPFGVGEGTSNVATGKKVELDIKGGKVFVIRNFNIMMENDLI